MPVQMALTLISYPLSKSPRSLPSSRRVQSYEPELSNSWPKMLTVVLLYDDLFPSKLHPMAKIGASRIVLRFLSFVRWLSPFLLLRCCRVCGRYCSHCRGLFQQNDVWAKMNVKKPSISFLLLRSCAHPLLKSLACRLLRNASSFHDKIH